MRRRTFFHAGVTLLFVVSGAAFSQQPADPPQSVPRDPGFAQIKVLARTSNDSVVLRWAPNTPHGWYVANRTGYVVERRSGAGQFTRMTPDTLHPWMPEQFLDAINADRENALFPLALQAVWGDSVLLDLVPTGGDTVGAMAELSMNLYSYALFAADNDPNVASALGLRYVDRTVRAGETYTYRIRLNEPRPYRIDAGEVTVVVRPPEPNPPPANLTALGLDGRIEIRWDELMRDHHTGYNIYRSEDGGRIFNKLNSTPIVMVTRTDTVQRGIGVYTDSTIVNYRPYKYRVRGINAFGELGPHAEVEAMGRDLTPPAPPIVKNPEQIERNRIRLTWDVIQVDADLAGFIVSRSALSDSNFRPITPRPLPKTARTFIDERPDDAEPYYLVSSIDTAGNTAAAFPVMGFVIDSTPPAVPRGLSGMIDTNGVVHLRWNKNLERNIFGYRVLRANAADHEFAQLTGDVWRDTTFTDTVEVNTLTLYIYYRIAAVNNRYNHSELSPILALRRPDRVPPDAPVFTDVQVSDSAVMLKWAASTSEDMHSHVLYRRPADSASWSRLAVLSRTASEYVDKAVKQSVMYEYQIEAVDSSGLRAMALLSVQGRPYDTGVRPPVSGLNAQFDPLQNKIVLTWSYSTRKEEKFHFLIYRSAKGSPFNQFKAIPSGQQTFTDTELLGDGAYIYGVQVVADNGAQSRISERAQVSVYSTR